MSVLGGLSTLAASYLAKMLGSGEPEASTATCAELENFVRELQAYILDTGHLAGEKHRDTVRQYRERLEKILGNEPTGIIDLVKGGASELGHNVVDYFDHTGHQLGRQWGAQMQGVRSEIEGDLGRAQAGFHAGARAQGFGEVDAEACDGLWGWGWSGGGGGGCGGGGGRGGRGGGIGGWAAGGVG